MPEGRRAFINKLNDKKNAKEFLVPSCSFGLICKLATSLLDRIYENNDVTNAKQIMYLSQYFYEETLGHKTFMHQILLTHQLWEDHKLWTNLIISSVFLEIESDAKICSEDLTSANQTLKLRPVVFNKITNYITQMKIFMLDSLTIEKVLKMTQEYYNFNLDIIKIAE